VKRVLVTGGTGFLGRHLVDHLRRTEPMTQLRLLCRASTPAGCDPAVEIVRGDVADPDSVLRAMDGVNEVYHLAGRVSRLPADRHALLRTHVEGARSICGAAVRCRPARLVVVSTSGVVAVSRRPTVQDEWAEYPYELVSRWPYYSSKLFAEKLVLSATAEYGLPTVVVNPTLVLGPDGGPDSTNAILAPLVTGRLPAAPRGGLSFVDVRDVAAILPVAGRLGRVGHRYLLTAANCTFRDLAGRISVLTGRPAPRLPPLPTTLALDVARLLRTLPGLAQRLPLDDAAIQMSALFWYADASKARAELGWAPRPPAETLAAAVSDLQPSELSR
jgi:dihydroflavonol-4-reductase